jgi:CubicO group peptidase (beta-lactamase class C family)
MNNYSKVIRQIEAKEEYALMKMCFYDIKANFITPGIMIKLFLFLLLPLASAGQTKYAARLDSFMQAEVRVNHFNGNVLIAKSGKIIYQKPFGYRNYNTKEPLINNSIFELASITKQFTAMAILQLMEKGKLTLADTLRHYFPELPYNNISIQHLLTHTSGLPDEVDVMAQYWDHKKVASNKDLIHVLASHRVPAHFQPGEKWEYSNTAYELLACIVEKVSGLSYAAYIRKNIFDPLGMHSSFATTKAVKSNSSIANYAYGFVYSDSLKKYVLPATIPEFDFVSYLEDTYGAGNISSTTSDLLKWDRALKQHRLLSKPTQEAMFSPQLQIDTASQRYYGYGVIIGANEIGDYVFHGGGWPGYNTMIIRYVKDDLTLIILSNNGANTMAISGALAYIVTDRSVELPYIHKAIAIDPTLLSHYTGKYKVANVPKPFMMELLTKEGKLYCHFGNAAIERELKAESTTKFFNDNVGQQVEFEVDSTGNVVKAFFIYGGMKKRMEKIKE